MANQEAPEESPNGPQENNQLSKVSARIKRNNKIAAGLLFIFQIFFIVLYAIFCRPQGYTSQFDYGLAPFTGVAILVLLGFGLFFSYLKYMSWSGVGFTLLIAAFTFQLYFLINGFWSRVNLQIGWDNAEHIYIPIYLSEQNSENGVSGINSYGLTAIGALRCILAICIAFHSMGGRVGPVQAILISLFGTIFYEVNRQILTLFSVTQGCSTYLFEFAGFFGGIMGLFLTKCKQNQIISNVQTYTSGKLNVTLTLFGVGLIWVFFPVINMDVPSNLFILSISGISTYISMATSVVTIIAMGLIVQGKMSYRDIITAPIAGGVIASSASMFLYNPLQGLLLGFFAGLFQFIFNRIEIKIGNSPPWSNSVFFLFGVQGFLGGIASAIMKAVSKTSDTYAAAYESLPGKYVFDQRGQISATFVSMGIGLVGGLVLYGLVHCINVERRHNLYQDKTYWWVGEDDISNRQPQEAQQDYTVEVSNPTESAKGENAYL